MSDQAKSDTPPVDWTDDGILRGAFLALFDPADRAVLRRAGAILACQAIAGDEGGEPIVRDLRAAAEDARMLARHLQQVAEMRHGSGDTTDRQHALCLLAEQWQRQAADLAYEIEGDVEEASEPAPTIETGLTEVAEDLQRVFDRLKALAEREWPPAEDQEEQETLISLAGNWQGKVESLAVEIAANVEEEPEPVPASALGPEEAAAALRLLEKLRAALEEARNLQRLDREGVIGRSVGNLAESVTVLEAAIKGKAD